MVRLRHILCCCLWVLVACGAGCRRPSREVPVLVADAAARPAAAWPPVLVDEVPASVRLPWAVPPGAELELWRIDLLDADRPELAQWLEAWQPGAGGRPRRLPLPPDAVRERRLAIEAPGSYIVRSRAPGGSRVALILASRLRAALTLEDNDVEVFCADAHTGQPVSGAFVKVLYRTERLGRERVQAATGATDKDGRWHSSLVRDRFARRIVATAIVSKQDHYAVARAERTFARAGTDHRLAMRARRAVYHPGQRARFAGVLQRRRGRFYAPVGNAAVEVRLLGPDGSPCGATRVRTDPVGAFDGQFRLPEEARPGTYSVVATVQGEARFGPRRIALFSVREVRPEPFVLRMSLSPPVLAPGGELALTVSAAGPDGTPLPGAQVRILSWGYPVGPAKAPGWARRAGRIDRSRVAVLPLRLPVLGTTGEDGKLALRWKPNAQELHASDLLCAVHVAVAVPGLGVAQRTAELVLLSEALGVRVETDGSLRRPGEPIELKFKSTLTAPEQAAVRATCSLTFEDTEGRSRTCDLFTMPVATLVERRLAARMSRTGRYTFSVRTGKAASAATVWVADKDSSDVAWRGAAEPALFPERSWCRRGEALRAVVAAPGRQAPVALTLRSGSAVRRRLLPLRTGARSTLLRTEPRDGARLDVALAQIHQGGARMGRARIDLEPDGRVLEVDLRLLRVSRGERPGRDYGLTTRDRLGNGVQSVVRLELVRPTFDAVPPAAVQCQALQWYPGEATSEKGELKAFFHQAVLADSYGVLIDALSPEGRAGLRVLRTHVAGRAPRPADAKAPSPAEHLAALVRHGVATPEARWLGACLLASQPALAAELPTLIQRAASDDEAAAIVRLAATDRRATPDALAAALARGGAARAAALGIAPQFPGETWPAVQRVLASDMDPAVRAAAARALGPALPEGLGALTLALASDPDPGVRAAAASSLATGGEKALAALARAAPGERDAEVRLAIIGALRRLGGVPAATALLDLAPSREPEVGVAALRALSAIGYRGADRCLVRILRSGPPAARAEAAVVLSRSGSARAAQAILAAAGRSPNGALVKAVAGIHPETARSAMARWLTHDDPEVRLAAAEYLASLKDDRARPVLRAFLEPTVAPELAGRAASQLIAWRDDPAVPGLVRLLETRRLPPQTRRELVRTAGKLGWQQAGRPLVAILWRGLAEPGRLQDAEERELWLEALRAVATIGPVWDAEVRRAIGTTPPDSLYAPALEALRTRGLESFLRELWHSPLPLELRRAAVVPYARVRGRAAAPELVGLLESPVLQGPAAEALVAVEAVDALRAALRHPSPRTRATAAAALGALGDAPSAPVLKTLLRDADPFVRQEAAFALAAVTRKLVVYTDHLGEPRQAEP